MHFQHMFDAYKNCFQLSRVQKIYFVTHRETETKSELSSPKQLPKKIIVTKTIPVPKYIDCRTYFRLIEGNNRRTSEKEKKKKEYIVH